MAPNAPAPRDLSTICVYCGSSPGRDPACLAAARHFGTLLATTGRRLVYGGGRVGMMGALADAVLQAGGTVVGVIPRSMVEKELAHPGATEMHIVDTMHERKALMSHLSAGFVALPGGLGTMDELFETWTWSLLGVHEKPVGLLDTNGFFGPLVALVDGMVDGGFVRADHRDLLVVDDDPARLLARMAVQVRPEFPKWVDERGT